MNMQTRKLADLRPAEYNPRKELQPGDAEFEKLRRSVQEFGYIDPIIVNEDGTIIGGHQRYNVLLSLGYTEAECVVLSLDKTREKALNIAMNKIAGEWDEEKLKDLLVDLEGLQCDVTITGFNKTEVTELISKVSIPAAAADDNFDADAAAEAIEAPTTKTGDIWRLGRHRLMCGDSTKLEDVSRLMGERRAQLIVTDPPYNVSYGLTCESGDRHNNVRDKKSGSYILNDHMKDGAFYSFLFDAFTCMERTAAEGAAAYIFHSDTETVNFRTAMKTAGFKISECLIWEKSQFVMGRQDYHWRHEPVLYGWKEGAAHFFIDDRSQDTILAADDIDFEGMKKPELVAWIKKYIEDSKDKTTVIFENKPHRSDLHPTMKPVELVGKFILNSSRPGWVVQDLFAGSGTTLIACEQLERTACVMEMEPVYCDVIVQRWEALTGQKAERLPAGTEGLGDG